ncbi:CDP-glycerol glycerophosphotransferase family protein [bacterium]|nr:CDP-glycerol glycerophosphotransferase family protein [bacterium]
MRTVFYILRNLHLPHLLPIYEWMSANSGVQDELTFSGPDFIPTTAERPGYGPAPETVSSLISQGINWISEPDLIHYKPDVIVMADADYRNGIDRLDAKIVNVNHGLISKGCFYTDNPLSSRDNLSDLVCVPGPYHRDALAKTVFKPIMVSGFVKFDPIFKGEISRDQMLLELDIDPTKKVILFAPTFNPELSAVPVVADTVRQWVNDDTYLLIKLHGMSPPEWEELYRLIADSDPRVIYIEDLDITPYLTASDVMVSDVSSAFMEFIALDKPVVLVNNPRRTSFIGFDPHDIEYAWRDVGINVDSADEIPLAIHRSLENPMEYSDKRKLYGPQLIGPSDGRASERIGKAIMALQGHYEAHDKLIGSLLHRM